MRNNASKIIKENATSLVSIEKSPFYFLDVSVRDDRRKILEITEEKSLTHDPDECSRARADLTNPRNRIALEMAWLPGVAPKKAKDLVAAIRKTPESFISGLEIEPLASANLMAGVIELLNPELEVDEWAKWILALAKSIDAVEPDRVLRLINEDRTVSGFTEIKAVDQIEKEIDSRKVAFKEAVKYALDSLDAQKLVETMTAVVEIATDNGNQHAPTLIDEVVDGYQIEAQPHLLAGIEKIQKIIEHARSTISNGEQSLLGVIDTLEKVVREWDIIAQPIQVSLKSRGLEHEISLDLGRQIRSLGVDVANENGFFNASKKITHILQDVFAELPDFAARLNEDSETLEDLFQQREEASAEAEEWKSSIAYEADIGAIFKDKLKISSEGIEWKNKTFPLNKITRVRWGGVKHSVNGIPTGTTYTVAFGDSNSEGTVELRREEVYREFLDRLWKTVCVRLMHDTLVALKNGEKIKYGDAIIDDYGVELTRHKFFSSERAYFKWDKVSTWSADGNFIIGAQDDKKCYSQISYLYAANAHIIQSCISASFKKWKGRLSGLLD